MTIDPAVIDSASRHLIAAGFAAAALASLARARWGYAVAALLAVIEAYARVRYPFHVWVRTSLVGEHELPGAKHALQTAFLWLVALIGCAALAILAVRFKRLDLGRRYMAIGGLIVAVMLALELISPHHLDRVIYHPEGPFARCAIVYFIGAAIIARGALMKPRRG